MDPDRQMKIVLAANSSKKLICSECKNYIDFQNTEESLFLCCTPENGACIKCIRQDCICCKKKRTFKLDKPILNQKMMAILSKSPELPKLIKQISQPHPQKKYQQPSNPLQSSEINSNKMLVSSPVKRSQPVKLQKLLCMVCDQQILNPINPKEELIICQICKKDNESYGLKQPEKSKDPVLYLNHNHISHIVEQEKIKQVLRETNCIICRIKINQNLQSSRPNEIQHGLPLCRMCKAQCQAAQLNRSRFKEEQKIVIQPKDAEVKIDMPQNDSSKKGRPEEQKYENLGHKPFFSQKLKKLSNSDKPQYMVSSINTSTIIRSKSEDSVDLLKMQSIEAPPETQKLQIYLELNITENKSNSIKANFHKNKISYHQFDIQDEAPAGQVQYRLSSCMVCKYSIDYSKGYYLCPNSKQIKSAQNQPYKNQQAIADENISFLCSHCIRTNIIKENNHHYFQPEQNHYQNQHIMDNGFRLYH